MARQPRIIQNMLDICEQWATEYHMEFAPTKCEYLGPLTDAGEGVDLRLYNLKLPKCINFRYLGIHVNEKGLATDKIIEERSTKGSKTLHQLVDFGFNLYGWPSHCSTTAYKLFIRSRLEYGLQLKLLTPHELTPIQQVQNQAMRRIVGGISKTSLSSMHRLLRLETMQFRNEVLHARFFGKLKNSLDLDIPATKMFHTNQTLTRRRSRQATTIASQAALNPLWNKLTLRNPIFERPSRNHGPETLRMDPLPLEQARHLRLEHIQANARGSTATAIVVDTLKIPRLLKTVKNRRLKSLLFRWRIGTICQHQVCLQCQQELSREHGLECSGARAYLQARYHGETIPAGSNILDHLLNKFDRFGTRRTLDYQFLAKAVELILGNCRGITISETGKWICTEDTSNEPEINLDQDLELNPTPTLVTPIVGNQSSNPALTARRRARAVRENNPTWRPRLQLRSTAEQLDGVG